MAQSKPKVITATPQKAESIRETAPIESQISAEHEPLSLLDLLSEMPHSGDIDFDPPPVVIELREMDFDAEQ